MAAALNAGFSWVAGNESVEAGFCVGDMTVSTEGHATRVKAYLGLCEVERMHWMDREMKRKAAGAEIQRLQEQITWKDEKLRELETLIDRMESSNSWKVTQPLRKVALGTKKLFSRLD